MSKKYYSGLLVVVLQLTGCATEQVTLLPQLDGKPSAVMVQLKTGESVVLDQPYMVAKSTKDKIALDKTDEASVNLRYKSVLDALPNRTKSYTLPFNLDDSDLTPEALGLIQELLRDIEHYPAPELIIIGHTDARGGNDLNDKLAQERATTVLNFLKSKTIDTSRASVVGRGSREPLIKNEHGASEPRNRRVEIRLK